VRRNAGAMTVENSRVKLQAKHFIRFEAILFDLNLRKKERKAICNWQKIAASLQAGPTFMKLTFRLRFHAKVGQSLFLTGNHEIPGGGRIEKSCSAPVSQRGILAGHNPFA
jgi:hypothetical protein